MFLHHGLCSLQGIGQVLVQFAYSLALQGIHLCGIRPLTVQQHLPDGILHGLLLCWVRRLGTEGLETAFLCDIKVLKGG